MSSSSQAAPAVVPSLPAATPPPDNAAAAADPEEMAHLDRLMRWCVQRRAGLWAPLLFYSVTLAGSFVLDDVYMVRRIERYRAGEHAAPGLFRFIESPQQLREQRDRTSCPWWVGGDGNTMFFRPLPEALFVVDHLLFGRAVLGYRLMSLAWFLLALLLVRRLYAAAGATQAVTELATLLFGCAQSVATPAAFISNRSDLLVVVGVATASIALWSSQARAAGGSRSSLRWMLLAALAFAFALCSKEAAVSLAGVWLVHAWIDRAGRGDGEPDRAASGRRWTFAALASVMAAAYLVFYLASGYGIHVSGVSLTDRLAAQWRGSARTAALLLPVWMMGVPAILLTILDLWTLAWITAGIAVLIAVVVVVRGAAEWRRSAALRFFAVWAVVMSLPALLATSEPRVLCVATVGWAYVAARLFVVQREPARGRWARALRVWMITANGGMTLLFGVGTVLYMQFEENACRGSIRAYLAAQPRALRDGDALIVTQPQHTLELLAPGERLQWVTGTQDARLHYLTVADAVGVRRQVEDDRTLLLTADAPGFFGGLLHPTRADDGPLRVGAKWETRDFTVTIAGMKQGDVTALRVRFTRPMDSPDLLFCPPLNGN